MKAARRSSFVLFCFFFKFFFFSRRLRVSSFPRRSVEIGSRGVGAVSTDRRSTTKSRTSKFGPSAFATFYWTSSSTVFVLVSFSSRPVGDFLSVPPVRPLFFYVLRGRKIKGKQKSVQESRESFDGESRPWPRSESCGRRLVRKEPRRRWRARNKSRRSERSVRSHWPYGPSSSAAFLNRGTAYPLGVRDVFPGGTGRSQKSSIKNIFGRDEIEDFYTNCKGGYVGLGEIGPRGTWPKKIEKHCVTRWMRNENASSVASSATCLRDATAIGFASIAQCRSLESRFESGIGAISPSLTRALVNDDKMAPDAKRKMAPERDPSAAAVDLDDCRRSAPIVTPIVK